MTVTRSAIVFATAFVCLTTVASAESYSSRVRNACTGDAQRLCPKQKLGSSEMRYCMEARARSLSSGCVRALEDDGQIPRGFLRR
jgi:hypothetical protein